LQIFNRYLMDPIGQIFLRLIFMIVVPMVMSGLMLGVYQLSNHHGLARVAKRTLFFTLLASSASVAVGISLVNLAQPGVGLDISQMLGDNASVNKIQQNAAQAKPVVQSLLEIIPKNPFASATQALEGEMLSLMFFSLAFGAALAATNGDKPSRWVGLLEETYAACLLIVDTAMKLAPIAVFALVFQSTFKFGHHILFSLGFYVLVVVNRSAATASRGLQHAAALFYPNQTAELFPAMPGCVFVCLCHRLLQCHSAALAGTG